MESLKADLYDRACQGLLYGQSELTPMVEINNLMKKLEEAGIEYTSMIRHFIFEGMNGEIGPSSAGIEKMIEMFGLTAGDIDSMDDAALCRKWESYECIRKSFLQVEGENTISGEQKAVLDWYNNTSLIDPCSGEEMNKDDILLQACAEGSGAGLSMSAIDAALEGKDYIERTEAFKNCEFYNCIFRKLRRNAEDCESLWKILTNKKIKTTLDVKPTSWMNERGGANMFVSLSKDKKSIELYIDDNWCNKDKWNYDSHALELRNVATLLHEFIHIEWLQTLIEKGYDPTGLKGYQELWPLYKKYLEEEYKKTGGDLNYLHHYIMLHIDNSIRKIAADLFRIFDGNSHGLTIDHFMMSGANGLFEMMTPEFKKEFYAKYDAKSEKSRYLTLGCK